MLRITDIAIMMIMAATAATVSLPQTWAWDMGTFDLISTRYHSDHICSAFGGALGLGVAFLIMHIVQIALFGRRKLTPAANFGIELSRLIIWLGILILEIVAFNYGDASILAIAFVSAVWSVSTHTCPET